MSDRTLRDASRHEWNQTDRPTFEQINAGSLQRIADATEKMAASYDRMRADRDYWKARCERAEAREASANRSNAALRGVVKRMKRGAP